MITAGAGHRISLAGGIGPGNFAAVIAAAPDIAVIGSSVSAADDPEGTAAWLRQQLS
jgi:3-keto-L-gulonate-6-phosphate decarboxylase